MFVLTTRLITGPALRATFTLTSGEISIPGNVYERESPKIGQDKYYWNFAGKFQWEVGDTLPPFSVTYNERQVAADLFFGIPQVVMKLRFGFTPSTVLRYKQGEYRTCKNCTYLIFNQKTWEEYRDRSTAQRYESSPSFYTCAVTGSQLDRRNKLSVTRDAFKESKTLIASEGCDAQTRQAYKVPLSVDAQKPGQTERWIPAENRRFHALNPEAILYQLPRVIIAGIPVICKEQ